MEKGRLQYQVEMIAQAEGVGNFRGVNCIEGDTAVRNVPFGLGGQVLFQLLSVIRTVDQISSAGTDLLCIPTVFLLAPTVPSVPRPQNLQLTELPCYG